MTRTIKASEIKPGMNIRFDLEGWGVKGTVARMHRRPQGMWLYTDQSFELSLDLDDPVTVLSEPQPAEPTEFGAKVRVRKGRFVRLVEGDAGFLVWFEEGTESWWTWDELCEMGPVTVVPDQGWEVPADAPEVPERIEEWPEDDTALRPYKWRGRDGYIWKWLAAASEWECYDAVGNGMVSGGRPSYGPWTRATDA